MNKQTRKALQSWVDRDGFKAVAAIVHVSENTVARWLAGLSVPHPNTLEKVREAMERRKGSA